MKSQLKLCLLLSISALLLSCGNDSPTGTDPDPDPTPDPGPAPNVVSKEIGPDGGEITSADGLLTLTFPAGALGNTETITIAPLDADSLGSEFDDIGVEIAYDLGPDGLEFNLPVMVSFNDDQDPNVGSDSLEVSSISLLSSENGEKIPLDSLQTIVDSDNGSVIGKGLLSHFSPLVKSSGAMTLRIGSLPDTVEISTIFFDVFVAGEVDLSKFDRDSVLLAAQPEPPLEVEDGSGLQKLVLFSGAYIQNVRHRCLEVGTGKFIIAVTIEADSQTGESGEFIQVMEEITCVEEMPIKFDLQVVLDGTGSGEVLSDTVSSGNIHCPDACSDEFFEGEDVLITAFPDDGSVFTIWSGDIGSNAPDNPTISLTMDQARSVTATFELEQVNGGFLQLGLFTLPILTNPETVVALGGPEQAFANFPESSVPALMQGAEGFIVIDLRNGEVLLDFTGLPNNGSVGERIPLGALGVSRPNPGPNTLSLIASYGQDSNSTEFGFNLFPYDILDQSFINGPVSPFPSTIDAFPIGGNVISDETVIVREGGFGIIFNRYNAISNEYLFEPSNEARTSSRYGFEQPVTAYGEFVNDALLVVNTKGDLYFDPRNRLIPSSFIGNVGEQIRKIRCEIPVCVTTDFSGDALRIIIWDGLNQPEIKSNPLQVGDGPVDPDLYKLPNGNTLIGGTGFNDNTISLLEVDPAGTFISGQIYNAPDGLVNPGHFHFINNPDDQTNPFVIITGFGSDNYYLQDTIEIRKLTVNAGIRHIE